MTCPSCPKCGADSIVIRNGADSGERRRKCLDCGHEYETCEVYAHQHPGYIMRQQVREILSRGNGGQRE